MSNPAESVESEALALPLEDRMLLAQHLLESIESRPIVDPQTVEKKWLDEANRRYEAYLRGEEKAIPAKEVFADLRADDR